jgi:DNA adenine methylase
MKYLGSKNRISKEILPLMIKHRTNETWVEPFVGGANMIDKVKGNRIGADLNEYVISLLNQMSKPNYKSPEINEEKYNDIKKHLSQYPRWIVGYAGTQLSFGATWFGSYRRDKQGERNYCLEAQNNVNKQSKNIQGMKFIHSSYQDLEIPKNSIIYCDPPYDTKATKGKYKDEFKQNEFWEWVRTKTNEGHMVYVSEYNAPKDFKCIWEKEISQIMNNNAETSKTNEKLFVYCS